MLKKVKKKDKIDFTIIFDLSPTIQGMIIFINNNMLKTADELFYIGFVPSFQNLMCILHLKNTST